MNCQNLQITESENGMTRVFDGKKSVICLISFSPENNTLISLRYKRLITSKEMEKAFNDSSATPLEYDNLSREYRMLTQKIKAEAKRLGIPDHSPFAH